MLPVLVHLLAYKNHSTIDNIDHANFYTYEATVQPVYYKVEVKVSAV